MIEGLTEGRMVHYVAFDTDGFYEPERHRPAVVVRVWDKESGCANLQVLTDGSNDGPGKDTGHYHAASRLYSEDPKPGTWHYIERS